MQSQLAYDYSLSPTKSDQLVKIVPKVWGHEEWIINTDLYCGKKLVFKKGYRLSLHYHKVKDETFYVVQGKVLIELIQEEKRTVKVMTPGDSVRIYPFVQHRITAFENSEVMEFSTRHMDEDSYRIEMSGKAPESIIGEDK